MSRGLLGALARIAGMATLILGALAACTTPEPIVGKGGADEFSRTGRFALTVTDADGQARRALQGGFSWLDDGRHYVLDLTNPLGSIAAKVRGGQGGALLTRADGTQESAPDPDSLVENALGSRVPVAGMRSWLRGALAASPPASAVEQDQAARPIAFEQGGWQARLSRYDSLGPCLLVLTRRADGKLIVLRLAVNPI